MRKSNKEIEEAIVRLNKDFEMLSEKLKAAENDEEVLSTHTLFTETLAKIKTLKWVLNVRD